VCSTARSFAFVLSPANELVLHGGFFNTTADMNEDVRAGPCLV
jgi:hypothetical protein